jgi:hypothetical protein
MTWEFYDGRFRDYAEDYHYGVSEITHWHPASPPPFDSDEEMKMTLQEALAELETHGKTCKCWSKISCEFRENQLWQIIRDHDANNGVPIVMPMSPNCKKVTE